MTYLVVSQHLC